MSTGNANSLAFAGALWCTAVYIQYHSSGLSHQQGDRKAHLGVIVKQSRFAGLGHAYHKSFVEEVHERLLMIPSLDRSKKEAVG